MEERRLFVPWQEDPDGTAGAIDGLLARGKQPIVPLIVEPEPEIETELAWL
jgi:hypothetical protein